MQLNVDHNSKTPIYLQIYRELRSKITSGAFPEGTRLPSKRTLTADCGVSIATVEHAYSVLCEEDYCCTRERSGCYVIYSPQKSFPAAEFQPSNCSIPNDNFTAPDTLIPFSAYVSGIKRVLSSMGEKILLKSPNNGCGWLREAIARYLLRRRNIAISPGCIVIGSGAEYLYECAFRCLDVTESQRWKIHPMKKQSRIHVKRGAM